MIGVQVNKNELNDIINTIKEIKRTVNSNQINVYRAQRYKSDTIDYVDRADLSLTPISDATRKISGGDHNPLWDRGQLVRAMDVKPIGKKGAVAGYIRHDHVKKQAEPISVAKWAILMHTGFKIPLTGDKGEAVRKFLARPEISIFPKAGTEFLSVPPRPFMLESLHKYEDGDKDIAYTIEAFHKIFNSVMGKEK